MQIQGLPGIEGMTGTCLCQKYCNLWRVELDNLDIYDLELEHLQIIQAPADDKNKHAVLARVLLDTATNGGNLKLWKGNIVKVISMSERSSWDVQCEPGRDVQLEKGLVKKECLELLGCHCDDCNDFWQGELVASRPDDTEIQLLMALRGTGGESMHGFWHEPFFNNIVTHAAAAAVALLLLASAIHQAPTPTVLILGTLAAFLGVDLASTAYHVALDYALFARMEPTVTDYHHPVPLNYILFDWWKLLASSYVAVFPCTLLHVLLWALLSCCKGPSYLDSFMPIYCASFYILGLTTSFTHVAAHRRNHGLPIPMWACALQDVGIILHPEVHSLHHRDDFEINYSLFSGLTHPISNLLIKLARRLGLLPMTIESRT